MTISGRIWVFGDHVDTDVIIPACYLHTSDPAELARHCMEGLDAGFPDSVQSGDLIVAGENFGCGSSREHAPLAIKAAGVGCVIARSFARIFYRKCDQHWPTDRRLSRGSGLCGGRPEFGSRFRRGDDP